VAADLVESAPMSGKLCKPLRAYLGGRGAPPPMARHGKSIVRVFNHLVSAVTDLQCADV
jgi:hypothetical protein